jgi:hypothetical protein
MAFVKKQLIQKKNLMGEIFGVLIINPSRYMSQKNGMPLQSGLTKFSIWNKDNNK